MFGFWVQSVVDNDKMFEPFWTYRDCLFALCFMPLCVLCLACSSVDLLQPCLLWASEAPWASGFNSAFGFDKYDSIASGMKQTFHLESRSEPTTPELWTRWNYRQRFKLWCFPRQGVHHEGVLQILDLGSPKECQPVKKKSELDTHVRIACTSFSRWSDVENWNPGVKGPPKKKWNCPALSGSSLWGFHISDVLRSVSATKGVAVSSEAVEGPSHLQLWRGSMAKQPQLCVQKHNVVWRCWTMQVHLLQRCPVSQAWTCCSYQSVFFSCQLLTSFLLRTGCIDVYVYMSYIRICIHSVYIMYIVSICTSMLSARGLLMWKLWEESASSQLTVTEESTSPHSFHASVFWQASSAGSSCTTLSQIVGKYRELCELHTATLQIRNPETAYSWVYNMKHKLLLVSKLEPTWL